jgi:type II secretory pathway component PulJ
MLGFAVAFAFRRACNLCPALQELTEEERYRVANDVLHRSKQQGNCLAIGGGFATTWKDTLRSKTCPMRTRHLSRLLIVAILLISTAPLYAQR